MKKIFIFVLIVLFTTGCQTSQVEEFDQIFHGRGFTIKYNETRTTLTNPENEQTFTVSIPPNFAVLNVSVVFDYEHVISSLEQIESDIVSLNENDDQKFQDTSVNGHDARQIIYTDGDITVLTILVPVANDLVIIQSTSTNREDFNYFKQMIDTIEITL